MSISERERIPGSPESSTNQFRVVVAGQQEIFDWLNFVREAKELPFTQGPPTPLSLAEHVFDDKILGAIRTTARFLDDGPSYKIETDFFPPTISKPRTNIASLIGLVSQVIREKAPPKAINITTLASSLCSRLNGLYDINYSTQGNFIELVQQQSEAPVTFVFHLVTVIGKEIAYCFHLASENFADEEQFSTNLTNYAFLLEHLLSSLYQIKEQPSPQGIYEMKPPKNLKQELAKARQSLEMNKRALTADGVLDDTAELESQIERFLVSERPDITFNDIAGHKNIKEELLSVAVALETPEVFERWGTSPPRGIILAGPPGTGKTMLAKALANRVEARFFNVKLSEVIHHLWGRTERLVAKLFDFAQRNGPAIIFIDELEALAMARGSASSVHDQIVSVLLTELDGLRERGGNVVVIGATNRIEVVDQALLRPGRMGDIIFRVDLPSPEVREEIFSIHMGRAEARAARKLFEAIELPSLIDLTNGYSGADIEEVVRRVLYDKAKQEFSGQAPSLVTSGEIVGMIGNYEETRDVKTKRHLGF